MNFLGKMAAPDGSYGLNKNLRNAGVYVAESLVAVKNEKVNIRMLNSFKNPVKITDYTIISNLYEIHFHDNVFFTMKIVIIIIQNLQLVWKMYQVYGKNLKPINFFLF